MKRDWKNPFTKGDFNLYMSGPFDAQRVAAVANKIIAEMLAEAPKLYGRDGRWIEYGISTSWETNKRARLVDITEIEK